MNPCKDSPSKGRYPYPVISPLTSRSDLISLKVSLVASLFAPGGSPTLLDIYSNIIAL